MDEPITNIGWVCPDHIPKPKYEYFQQAFNWFVGKYCKLGFPTGQEKPGFEFMWVKVTKVVIFEGKEQLVGELDNTPIFVEDYQEGDEVGFDRTEICDVME